MVLMNIITKKKLSYRSRKQACGCYEGVTLGDWDWCMKVKVKVTQSCPTLCNPIDCTVHGIL